MDVAVGGLQYISTYTYNYMWRMRWHGIRYSSHILHAPAHIYIRIAHESLAFPFVFCNYALSWIVDDVAVLLLALQVLHLITAHISQISLRLSSQSSAHVSVSATRHYHYHYHLYLHLRLRVSATESASCSANIMLIMHFTLQSRMQLQPVPFSLLLCWESSLRKARNTRRVICLLKAL